MTTTEIVTQLSNLPRADWEKIKETVDNGRAKGAPKPSMSEEEFAQYLLSEGIISRIPSGETDEEFDDYEPIVVDGEPLSDMIIRERR